MVPQNVTEAILLGRLRELGGDVHRPYVATDLWQDADGVTVTVAADGQPPQTVRARSVRNGVIGVIGRIPAVRRRLAMELAGLRNR